MEWLGRLNGYTGSPERPCDIALWAFPLEKVQGTLPNQDGLPPMILPLCKQVQAHYMEPLHLKELAERSLVCPEHLSRVSHQSTGLRFRDYLAKTYVAAAYLALTEGNDPIP